MSIISDYWRYYANVDITKDFKSAIDCIYNWFFHKLWEHSWCTVSYVRSNPIDT